jgi:rubrerythrin
MKKFRCTVCGYIHTGDNAPDKCPVCGAPKDKFVAIEEGEKMTEKNLVANWDGETEEVGLYLAYARQAEMEGLPEVAQAFIKIAVEEGWHAAEIAKIQGKVKTTKENLAWRAEAERGAEKGKAEAAEAARTEGYTDAAEFFTRASKDEGRHGAQFEGMLKRYFGK